MNKRILLLIPILLMMLAPAASLAGTSYPTVFSTHVSFPDVYTNETFTMYMNSTYGFDNYTTMVVFSGVNLSGMPHTYALNSGHSPNQIIYVTTPATSQTLTVYLHSYASSSDGKVSKSYYRTFTIKVVSPIVLNATITNPTPSAMNNISVTFSMNNNNITTVKIASISPYGSYTVTTETSYVFLLNKGTNTETIYVDNPGATVNGQTSVYSTTFHYGPHTSYSWIYYIAAAVVVFMLFMVLTAGRKLPARRPKWKKK